MRSKVIGLSTEMWAPLNVSVTAGKPSNCDYARTYITRNNRMINELGFKELADIIM